MNDSTADQNGVSFVDFNAVAHKLFADEIFEALEKLSVDETAEQHLIQVFAELCTDNIRAKAR